MRTLPREPWRGSMICGWQTSSGGWSRPMEFCGNRKGDGLYVCPEHWQELIEYGDVHFADGNAYGESHIRVRLRRGHGPGRGHARGDRPLQGDPGPCEG
jgi:hypothetical protein